MKTAPNLGAYLETVTGEPVRLAPVSASLSAGLPLFLRRRYRLQQAHLFGRSLLLAEETEVEPASPKEYAAHLGALEARSGMPVVLVPRPLPSYLRNRLVHARIPFIVPGSQMFLPTLFVDLRERTPRVTPAPGGALSAPAQALVCYHLDKARLDAKPLRVIAGLLGYSPMMISKAKDELTAAGLCESRSTGRVVELVFPMDRRALWSLALPRLSTPVRGTRWVRTRGIARSQFPIAGTTALAHQTSLADDAIPTLAAHGPSVKAALQERQVVEVPTAEEADARMEAWRYDPALLAHSGVVDPLSLYLSLRDSPDERVQQALATLLDDLPW
jgi:hypothetical protein